MNKPIRTVAIFCLLLFLALMINVTYLQYWKADELNHDAKNRRAVDASFSRERGAILVGREPIAESVPSGDAYDFQRKYLAPFRYAHVTGWFNYYNAQTGECRTCQRRIEQTQNDVLSGQDSRLFVTQLVDMLSNRGSKGGNVLLTLDPAAQEAAQLGLEGLGENVRAAVVALDPRTGRVLAMSSAPSFDPNLLANHDLSEVNKVGERLDKDPAQPLLNRAIQTTLPPGSTFKLVTAAAALESGNYTAEDDVPGGPTFQLPQTSGPNGLIDNEGRSCGADRVPFRQAMAQSCNTTFARLAIEVGAEKMAEQAEAFGFNSTYFTDLLPQAESVFPTDMNPPQTGQAGIGQFEVRSTPLQMAMVAAGIANNGSVMRPYLVEEVQSPELDLIEGTDPEELSQAISANTAKELTKLLVETVDNGTASPAAIPGVSVAGKTGTAQSGTDAPPYAWFTSFAPAEDPQVAVAVMIEQAPDTDRGEIGGGLLGGPIAKAVMEAVIG